MIHVGTSGYNYAEWRHLFYQGLPQRRWLEHYARVFSTVELNATFYRLPSPSTVDAWREGTPPGFRFVAKGSRYLTHMKRLNDAEQGIERYFERVLRLRGKLAIVLWQLPPQMARADPERLGRFLEMLPRRRGLRYAVEFRSDAWYTGEICDLLDAHGAAFCEHDLVQRSPPRTTGGFRYLRFHGATGKYRGRYGRAALRKVANNLKRSRHEAWVFFNNDRFGHAVQDALTLSSLLHLPHALRDAGRPAAAALE